MKTQTIQISNMTPSIFAPKFKLTKLLLTGAGVSLLATSVSQAVLRVTFNMRAVQTGVTAGDVSVGLVNVSPDGRNADILPGTSSVVLQLVATLAAADADLTNDGFTRTDGSFLTLNTTGPLTGSMRGDATTAPGANNTTGFRGTGAKNGNVASLSSPADNITDIGGTSATVFTDYFTSSSDSPTGVVGQVFVLGETILTLNGISGSTSVNYVPRLATGGLLGNKTSFTFKIDGVSFSLRGDGAPASQTGGVGDATVFAFNPITLTVVPEPSAFGMVLLGAMSVVGFRRLGIRRS